jgi:uncharacterized protein YfaS (alpha-2-macroglobulin family)
MEQTSSTSYPNVLVADYLTRARVARPDVLMQAQQLVQTGYQRILTFQTPGGGFGWWAGQNEPVVWVTAYGIHQLADTARVIEIDARVLERARAWLASVQGADGSWGNVGATHGERIASLPDPRLALTSYVAWAMIDSGGRDTEPVRRAIEFIRGNLRLAEDNPYVLALAANALAAYDPDGDVTRDVLARLRDAAVRDGGTVSWSPGGQTLSYAHGGAAAVETTALAALAFLRARTYTEDTRRALEFLISQKTASGGWGSTQATILALKALVAGLGTGGIQHPVGVSVRINGHEETLEITPDQADVVHSLDLTPWVRAGANEVEITAEGDAGLLYQVASRHYEPFGGDEERPSTIEVSVEYDRTRLTTEEVLGATARLRYHGDVPTYMVIVDLGIPPGFVADRSAFEQMVTEGRIQRFETTARQVTLYLGEVQPGADLSFAYRLIPKYPVRVQAPGPAAYEYYTPSNRHEAPSTSIEVVEP